MVQSKGENNMTDAQKNISLYVINQLRKKHSIRENDITEWVNKFSTIIPLNESEKKEVIKDVESKMRIKMN